MPPARIVPRVDALPAPLTNAPVDLEALARGFAANAPGASPPSMAGPRLLVFISLSMPEPTLQRLLDQAARAGAGVVLRGLADASLPRTVERVQRLIGTRALSIEIDPQAFDRYAISRVPSFMLARAGGVDAPCAGGQCGAADPYVVVAGDVSVDYALAHIQRSAPAFSRDAGQFLARLGR